MSTPESQQAYSQGYHVGYQHGLQAAQAQGGSSSTYPVDVVARYPEKSSRVLMFFRFFKIFLLIPHVFCLWFLLLAVGFVNFMAWWVVLFTGSWPRGMHEFVVGVYRWQMRAAAYYIGLTDEYPPFSLT